MAEYTVVAIRLSETCSNLDEKFFVSRPHIY